MSLIIDKRQMCFSLTAKGEKLLSSLHHGQGVSCRCLSCNEGGCTLFR